MDLSKETGKPYLLLNFFIRGVLPVVAVLNWNYLCYRGKGYYRCLGSPRWLRCQTHAAFYRSNSTACTLCHAHCELLPVGPQGQQHTPLVPISEDHFPICHLGTHWVGGGRPGFESQFQSVQFRRKFEGFSLSGNVDRKLSYFIYNIIK